MVKECESRESGSQNSPETLRPRIVEVSGSDQGAQRGFGLVLRQDSGGWAGRREKNGG